MTQHLYNLDWFSSNETRNYPIDSEASFVPVGYDSVPSGLMGVITDISFSLPNTYESDEDSCTGIPYLSALTITDDLLTLIICIDTVVDDKVVVVPLFAFSSTQRSLYTNRYYDLTSFADGCSGVIVFGEAAKTHRCIYKFTAYDAKFLPSVYNKYTVFPVSSLGIEGQSEYKGNVIFRGIGDVKVSRESLTGIGNAITFGLDYSVSEDTPYKYNGPCDVRPVSGTCARTSVESIGTAFPDDDGNVNIIGDGIFVYMDEGQLIIGTDYTLKDVCSQDKLRELIGEDQCDFSKDEEDEEEEEGEEGGNDPCDSNSKSVNFSSEVYASGIEISGQGITPLHGMAALNIPVLSHILYANIRISILDDQGYCFISFIANSAETLRIEKHRILYNATEICSLDPQIHKINVIIDRCTGVLTIIGDTETLYSRELDKRLMSVGITLNECRLESVRYKKSSGSSSSSGSNSSSGSESSEGGRYRE